MKTIKIIDLLNKIANDEVPKKIIYLPYATNNEYAGEYSYKDGDYLKDGWSNMWLFKEHLKAKLNNEVEIIEEEKEIEKIELMTPISSEFDSSEIGRLVCIYNSNICDLKRKLNELIEAVNEIKRG